MHGKPGASRVVTSVRRTNRNGTSRRRWLRTWGVVRNRRGRPRANKQATPHRINQRTEICARDTHVVAAVGIAKAEEEMLRLLGVELAKDDDADAENDAEVLFKQDVSLPGWTVI